MAELNYGRMMQKAMLRLVADALDVVAREGLPGEHHFYITFRTDHPGVEMPDSLREEFPSSITIVLQHEFSDLVVSEDQFSVALSFNGRLAHLVVPLEAVLQFADPSVEFGVSFEAGLMEEPAEEDTPHLEAVRDELSDLPHLAKDTKDDDEDEADADVAELKQKPEAERDEKSSEQSGEVVSLDSFRKK